MTRIRHYRRSGASLAAALPGENAIHCCAASPTGSGVQVGWTWVKKGIDAIGGLGIGQTRFDRSGVRLAD